MQRNKISAAAIAACSLLALAAIPNAFAGSISCDDVSLPKTNENHYYSIDADKGTCTKVSGEQDHPANGFNVYHYFYEYNGFTITETRGTYYRDGAIDKSGVFKLGCQKDSCPQTLSFKDGAGLDQKFVMTQSYSGRSVKAISADLQTAGSKDVVWATCKPSSDTKSDPTFIAHQVFDFGAKSCWSASNFNEDINRTPLSHDFRVLLNAVPNASEKSGFIMYWGSEFSNVIVNGEDVSASPNKTLKINTSVDEFRSYVVQFDRGGKTYQTTISSEGGSNTLRATALFERAIFN